MDGSSTDRGKSASPQAFRPIVRTEVKFEDARPDVHTARIPIAGAAWIDTDEGAVVVDTLLGKEAGRSLLERIHETSGPARVVIFSHGHLDHVSGAEPFLEDGPEIIAHRYILDRFEKYRILAEHRGRIASMQFNIPFRKNPPSFVQPTRLIDESYRFELGGKTFELYHARAETDDHVWVHIPEIRTVVVGDLIIGGFPNIGNPWKPTRFALGWARALEAVREKQPELLLGGGGGLIFKGDAVQGVLNDYIEAIHSIHDQVVDHINRDVPIDEMIHLVELPDHLKESSYLRSSYARIEFAVYNIYRWYHGYFDHNPAHLLPRPQREVNREIFGLIGDGAAVLNRARELFSGGKAQLGLQVLDVLIQAEPDNVEARKLRIEILERLGSEDTCLMSRNTWVYFIEQDREFLRSRGVL